MAEDDIDASFREYIRALDRYLQQCVEDVQYRPDAALWNTRRATEAIVGAVLVRTEKKDPWHDKNANLDDLVSRVAKRYVGAGPKLRRLKDLGNDGAHVRVRLIEGQLPWNDAGYAVLLLAEITRWFVAEAEGQTWKIEPPFATGSLRWCARLEQEGERAVGRKSVVTDNIGLLKERLDAASEEKRSLMRQIDDLSADLASQGDATRRASERTDAGFKAPRPGISPPMFAVSVSGAGLIGALAGALVATFGHAPAAEVPLAPPVEAPPKRLVCPPGTVEVGARTLTRRQIDRTHWPEEIERGPWSEAVPSFCLDDSPVSAAEYGTSDAARASRKGATTGDAPVNWVDPNAAERWCADAGGSLPTVAQWEVAMIDGRARLVPRPDDKTAMFQEWSSDPYPAAIFHRRAAPAEDASDHMFRGDRANTDNPDVFLGGWGHAATADSIRSFRCVRPKVPAR